MELVTYIAAFIIVIALIVAGAWFLKKYLSGDKGNAMNFFGNKEKRVGVVQSASVDGRRKLVLIRRDSVEHLIMTGGPVDILIESNIRINRPDLSDKNSEGSHSHLHSKIDEPGDTVKDK